MFRSCRKFGAVLLVTFFLATGALFAQNGGVGFSAGGGVHIPTVDSLTPGLRGSVGTSYQLQSIPLFFEVNAGYSGLSGTGGYSDANVGIIDVTAGAGYEFRILPFMSLLAYGDAGYGNETLVTNVEAFSGGALNYAFGLGLRIPLSDRVAADIRADLRAQMNSHFGVEAYARVLWTPFAGGSDGQSTRATPLAKPEPLENRTPDPGLSGAGSGLGFSAGGGVHIPLVDFLVTGVRVSAGASYQLAAIPLFFELNGGRSALGGTGGYSEASVGITDISASVGFELGVLPFMSLLARGTAGYGIEDLVLNSAIPKESGGAFNYAFGLGVRVPLGSKLAIDVMADLRAQMNSHFGVETYARLLWRPFGAAAGAVRSTPQPRRTTPAPQPLEDQELVPEPSPAEKTELFLPPEIVNYADRNLSLNEAGFSTVFPVFYRYYNDNPTGLAEIQNISNRELSNVELLVNIPAFMDLPQRQLFVPSMAPGEIIRSELQILYNNNLLDVTEGTQVAAQLILKYGQGNQDYQFEVNTVLNVENRNAMTWDDDRKAASFVTAKDPAILSFAKTASGVIRLNKAVSVNQALLSAMAVFEALHVYQVEYVIDPSTPYADLSANAMQIDFLQFPVQTLQYRAGDCDDLSILYASMLEAVGVETAFLTTPGHIFVAFNTGVNEDRIVDVFPSNRLVIHFGGSGWIPVEVTLLEDSFLDAWQTAGRNWSRFSFSDQANIIPVRDAWREFEPVGFDTGSRATIQIPARADMERAFTAQLDLYIKDALAEETGAILRRMEERGPSSAAYNRLGIIYARYGMLEEARDSLEQALKLGKTSQVLINLGNLRLIQKDNEGALEFYREAYQMDRNNPSLLKNLAVASFEVGDVMQADAYYSRLLESDPRAAEAISFIRDGGAEGNRASGETSLLGLLDWEESEE